MTAINLWAGQSYQLTRDRPASELVEELARGLEGRP